MPLRPGPDISLPRNWTTLVRSAMLQAIALASMALTVARSRAASKPNPRRSRRAELGQADAEIALLREELDIKDSRWSRLSSRRRPHYWPNQRLRILQLKAARGWSCEQAAQRFLIDEQTLRSWLRRADEEGEGALIQLSEPVNRFPDFVRYLVKQLKALLPTMGKVRIAQLLARAGLHLSATTVGRILKETEPVPEEVMVALDTAKPRRVTARRPGDLWHVDLTTVSTSAGFWVPWLPFAVPQSWPFCWWIGVIVDHCSRSVVGSAVFPQCPTSAQLKQMLARAFRRVGQPPKYIISDKGQQFRCASFKRWCRHRSIHVRFGAVGKYGSLAVIERFIRSMKNECTRQILVPMRMDAMRREISLYTVWYNRHRPNQTLGGRTPWEVYSDRSPANAKARFEPRTAWPPKSPCASPEARIKGERGTHLSLVVGYVEGRRHLPVVEIRKAA